MRQITLPGIPRAFTCNFKARHCAANRSQLLSHVWGTQAFVEERAVDVHIRRLRKTLEAADKDHLIQTGRGSGYRFAA